MVNNRVLAGILSAALFMIILAITFGLSAKVMVDLRNGDNTYRATYSPANETQANTQNGTVYTLTHGNIIASSFQWHAQNTSVNALLTSGNYTLSSGSDTVMGTVQLTSNSYNNSNATWDYDFTGDSESGSVLSNGSKTMANISSNMPTLGTIIIISAVIMVLIGAFAFVLGGGAMGGVSFR